MENLTYALEDPFEDLNFNVSYFDEYSDTLESSDTWHGILQLFMVLLVALNTALSIFFLYLTRKFKKLRTRPNFYLFHYVLWNSVYSIANVSMEIAINWVSDLKWGILCSYFEFTEVLTLFLLTCNSVSMLDWHFSYNSSGGNKCFDWWKKSYKKVFHAYLAVLLVWTVVGVILCQQTSDHVTRDFMTYSGLAVTLVTALTVNFFNCKTNKSHAKKKTVHYLIVANFIAFSWLLFFACHFLYLAVDSYLLMRIVVSLFYVPFFMNFFGSAVVVFVLRSRDAHFKMACDVVLKRSVRSYDTDDLNQSTDDDGGDDGDLNDGRNVPVDNSNNLV